MSGVSECSDSSEDSAECGWWGSQGRDVKVSWAGAEAGARGWDQSGDLASPPHWQRPLTHTEPDMGNYHPRATRAGSSVIRSTGDQGLWGQHQSVITLNWVGLRSKHWYHCGYLVMVTWNSFALSWIVRIKITRELFGCFHLSNWLLSARQQNDLGVEWGMWAFEGGAWLGTFKVALKLLLSLSDWHSESLVPC